MCYDGIRVKKRSKIFGDFFVSLQLSKRSQILIESNLSFTENSEKNVQ